MSKIPKNPAEIFQEITDDYKNVFGDELKSIILYGSAAKGDYLYKKSDINFLIILTEQGINDIKKCLPLIPKWQKRNVSTPLFLTQNYIYSSLDTFPIEFLDINTSYQVIYGEDIIKTIEIEEEDLRYQCERELRGKLLHLREGFLTFAANPQQLNLLISQSLSAFTKIFIALLKLADVNIPLKKTEILNKISEVFELDHTVFQQLLDIRKNNKKLSKQKLHILMEQYILEIGKLTKKVDNL